MPHASSASDRSISARAHGICRGVRWLLCACRMARLPNQGTGKPAAGVLYKYCTRAILTSPQLMSDHVRIVKLLGCCFRAQTYSCNITVVAPPGVCSVRWAPACRLLAGLQIHHHCSIRLCRLTHNEGMLSPHNALNPALIVTKFASSSPEAQPHDAIKCSHPHPRLQQAL